MSELVSWFDQLVTQDNAMSGEMADPSSSFPAVSSSEAEGLLALTESPREWALQEQRMRQDDEELRPENAAPGSTEAEAALEEWTAGMVRPPRRAEPREREEAPMEPISQLGLKSAEEAEVEAKYGI